MEVKKKLLDIVRDKIRFKHYSIKTEKSYVGWIKHYIFYHNKKHPIEMAKPEIEQFLTHLAVERKVSPSTQNQASSAILFLYKEVLGIDMSSWNNALTVGRKCPWGAGITSPREKTYTTSTYQRRSEKSDR